MKKDVNQKQQQLEAFRVSDKDQPLTTNQGLKISEVAWRSPTGKQVACNGNPFLPSNYFVFQHYKPAN